MQKIFFVLVLTVLCMGAQLLWAGVLGGVFVPNFVLIVIVFLNLYRGRYYSLGAAFLGGFFLDSFSGSALGVNTFSLVMCAFLTTFLKKYLYQPGVNESRVLMVLLVAVANSLLQYFVNLGRGINLDLGEAFQKAMGPEIILTALVASYTFERLKQCALRLLA